MKKMFVIAVMAILSLIVGPKVSASEGTINLSGNNAVCKITSVWKESDYRLIGRCEGLVYPYQTQYEHYVVWAHVISRDANIRVGDIERGYFDGSVSDGFDKLIISAEQSGSPRRPSDKIIMEANVEKFEFDRSETAEAQEEEPAQEQVSSNTQDEEVPGVDGEGSSLGRVVTRIVTAIITILLVIIGLVIVSSLIFRRRGSVSK